jgi:hypothetical protein
MPSDYNPSKLEMSQQLILRQHELSLEGMSVEQLKQVAIYTAFKHYELINAMRNLQKQLILSKMPWP